MAAAKGNGKGKGGMSGQMLATAGLVVFAAAYFAYRGREHFKPPVLSPLRAPKLTELAEFDSLYKDRMLWGSYRSGLYFGMRTRSPKGLLTGLLWFDPDDPNTLNQLRARHEASQGDGLTSYGWKRHDGRTYGTQELIDGEYNITLSMLKSFGPESGPGGDWSLRLQLGRTAGMQQRRRRISVVIYVGDEDTPREPWQVLPDGEVADLRGGPSTLLSGASSALGWGAGRWALHAMETTDATSLPKGPRSRGCRLDYLSMGMESKGYLLRVRELMLSTMWERLERQPSSNRFRLYLPNGATTGADLAMFQVTCVLPSAADFAFTSSSRDDTAISNGRLQPLLGSGLSEQLAAREREFDERFERVFGAGLRRQRAADGTAAEDFNGAGSTSASSSPSPSLPEGTLEVSKAALSNLLGSVGYLYGSSLVRTGGAGSEPQQYWPAPLFTAVPSRSFFPRGFLWDEGFHQLLVQKWDPQLSRDMIAHWLDLMNAQGWIPREQILGEEARSRVPEEFVVQNPSHANPPSLFLPIAKMAAKLVAAAGRKGGPDPSDEEDTELARVTAFLRRAWPRLEAWYSWFNGTQTGPLPGSYRWHGRDPLAASELNPKTLTSGLDDYPRASHPDATERHLDLRCWMALASQAMYDIGSSLALPTHVVERYRVAAASLSDLQLLQRLHFDEARGHFADWGTHTEDVYLTTKVITVGGPESQPPQRKTVSERVSKGWPLPQYVPQFGYVSLFPLIMKLLPMHEVEAGSAAAASAAEANGGAAAARGGEHSAGGADIDLTLQQLALLQDPNLLWSPYGLRSLAASASLYKKRNTADDPPYWRGQIWINVNYLVLRALSYYATAGGEVSRVAAAAHDELRLRLLTTVVGNYRRQGYLYEQYDDETGLGTSSHPFTGWTALVTLIAAQEY